MSDNRSIHQKANLQSLKYTEVQMHASKKGFLGKADAAKYCIKLACCTNIYDS